MGRRPLGDLSTVPVTLPMAAMASNAGRAISPQQSGGLVVIGIGDRDVFENDPRLQCQTACRQHSRKDGG